VPVADFYKNLDIQYIYMYIVGKYKNLFGRVLETGRKASLWEMLFWSVSQRVQMNFIFTDNMRILCLSCDVK